MSARNQSSDQHCKSTHGAYGDISYRAFSETSKPDASSMKSTGGESETRRIRNETSRCGLAPMGVAMKEREKPRDRCTQPNRGFRCERD
jgi:hypothetical protein